jgi:hypothetical protein
VVWVVWEESAELAASAGRVEWAERVVVAPRNFPPETVHGNTIHPTVVERPTRIARRPTVSVGQHAETPWRTVREQRGSRSAGRVAIWQANAVAAVSAIVPQDLVVTAAEALAGGTAPVEAGLEVEATA